MTETKFICGGCNKEYLTCTTEEEREAEQQKLFPELPKEEQVIVCHDCFVEIMDFNEPGQKRYEGFLSKEYDTQ